MSRPIEREIFSRARSASLARAVSPSPTSMGLPAKKGTSRRISSMVCSAVVAGFDGLATPCTLIIRLTWRTPGQTSYWVLLSP